MNQEFFRTAGDPLFVPSIAPGDAKMPSPEIYETMGEGNICAMLQDFYQDLDSSIIGDMFPKEMDTRMKAAERSAMFFIEILGGPARYTETFGPPRMRKRHLPFRVTPAGRDAWLTSFFRILEHPERYNFPVQHLEGFKSFLKDFSQSLVNSPEPS